MNATSTSATAVISAPAATVAVARRQPAAGVRLTVRGRRAVAGMVLASASVLAWGLSDSPAVAQGPERVITVQQGETLSEISVRELPEENLTEAIGSVMSANNLTVPEVLAGQKLVIPSE